MFKSTNNHGFQMQFRNGLTISVQFGQGHYCERMHAAGTPNQDRFTPIVKSDNAEIAIWDGDGNFFRFQRDTIEGYCCADLVAVWIERTQRAEDIHQLKSIAVDLVGLY
jgi:hypothetical protein